MTARTPTGTLKQSQQYIFKLVAMSIISQWGDSLAVRIPKHIAEQAGLQEGSSVSINVEQGGIVISSQRKKYTLDELLERVDPGDFGGEVDWGAAVGEEVW